MTKKWMLYTAGRITSSNCKNTIFMIIKNPAESTIKSITQYNDPVNKSAIVHDKKQSLKLSSLTGISRKNCHQIFIVEISGLCINSDFHILGASPKGRTKCHGKGLF